MRSVHCAYWHDKLSPFENTIKIYEYVVMKKGIQILIYKRILKKV